MSSNIWKKSVNIDGHLLHQYQQNEQSSLILIELAEHKKTKTYDAGNPDLDWDRHIHLAELSLLI